MLSQLAVLKAFTLVTDIVWYIFKCTGADIILDFVGAPYWESHSKCVAMDGRIVHLGFVSGFCEAKCSIIDGMMGHFTSSWVDQC